MSQEQPRFELLDHTADIGVVAYGRDLKEAFANAAYAMFSIIADLEGVSDEYEKAVEVTSTDQEALLVDWLNELLFWFDVEHVLFRRFDITLLEETRLEARAFGERVDLARHDLKMGIKAATCHMLKVERREERYEAHVIFDV